MAQPLSALAGARDRILNTALNTVVVVGFVAMVASLLRAMSIGWQPVMVFHIVAWATLAGAAVFRHRLPFLFRAWLLIGMLLALALSRLVTFGLIGMSVPALLMTTVFTTLLFGSRVGWMMAGVSLAMISGVGVGVSLGWISFEFDTGRYAIAPASWVLAFLSSLMFIGLCIAGISWTHGALGKQEESIRLLHRIAVAANEAYEPETVMQVCLDEVCAYTGWPVGHIYRLDEEGSDELVSAKIWHLENAERFATLRRVTEETRFAPGIGLPGRVLSSREPAWIVDVTKDPNFPRAKLAADIGIKAGFAFPILVGKDVEAVMEFFSTEVIEPDEHILEIMAQVGTLLGRVLERKRAEEALGISEMRLSGILDIAADAIISVDEAQTIVMFNQGAQNIFGYSADETLGKPLNMLLPMQFRAAHRGHIERFDQSPEKTRTVMRGRAELTGLRRDGTEFPVEISISKLELGGHKIFTAMLRDISKRKNTDEQLRQAQKMEAVGQLTGGVAHDFNNLLTVILGNVHLVRECLGENEHVQPLLDMIFQAGERGAGLTQRLLAFSRQQILAPVVIDLNEILEDTAGLLERALGEHIEITSTRGVDLWCCLADRSQIENAILNLALNARDAMPEGGRLSLETANALLDDEYAAAQAEVEPGEYVMLAVTDNGEGITPEHQERIFEPFFTTKKVGEGSGLGLSMIYGFVKQSGGHMAVYSEVGEGTTFKIYLPRTQKELIEQCPSKAAGDDHVVSKATILIVEDDPDVRALAVAFLSDMGCQVMEARSGPAAMELLGQDRCIDLLLTDMVLPGGMTGPALAAKVKENRPETPVVFMSGYAKQAMADADRLDGTEAFLPKPFRKQDLTDKVREVLKISTV